MTSSLSVAGQRGPLARSERAAIASLPMTFVPTVGGDADIIVVDGAAGWGERVEAAVTAGARGVLVAGPTTESVDALAALSERSTPIVLDTRWRHNPAVDDARAKLELVGADALLEVRAAVADARDADDVLRDLLVLAQSAAGAINAVRLVHSTAARVVARARAGERDVHATVDVTRVGAGDAWLRALGADGGVELRVPDAGTARAARLTVTDPAGHTLQPTRYESAHRAVWRRLAAAVRAGEQTDDVAQFQRVVEAM